MEFAALNSRRAYRLGQLTAIQSFIDRFDKTTDEPEEISMKIMKLDDLKKQHDQIIENLGECVEANAETVAQDEDRFLKAYIKAKKALKLLLQEMKPVSEDYDNAIKSFNMYHEKEECYYANSESALLIWQSLNGTSYVLGKKS